MLTYCLPVGESSFLPTRASTLYPPSFRHKRVVSTSVLGMTPPCGQPLLHYALATHLVDSVGGEDTTLEQAQLFTLASCLFRHILYVTGRPLRGHLSMKPSLMAKYVKSLPAYCPISPPSFLPGDHTILEHRCFSSIGPSGKELAPRWATGKDGKIERRVSVKVFRRLEGIFKGDAGTPQVQSVSVCSNTQFLPSCTLTRVPQ